MNYIHDFAEPPIKDNGYETLGIGTSKYSHVNARVTVELNCFYRCNGEVECIFNKSSENTCRHNIFSECQGKLTLRHGDRNLVEANFFIGSNVSRTDGVRVINAEQGELRLYTDLYLPVSFTRRPYLRSVR